jgi:hypothetical protein
LAVAFLQGSTSVSFEIKDDANRLEYRHLLRDIINVKKAIPVTGLGGI